MRLYWRQRYGFPAALFISLLVLASAGAIVHAMGHPLICRCGYVKLWHGGLIDAEVSQHLIDWYTASYVAHGIFVYGAMWLFRRCRPTLGLGILASATFAAIWQVLANTPYVVNSFALSTRATNYIGGSVINSVGDMMATLIGFICAAVLPIWLSPLLAIAILEFLPRDNPWFLVQGFFDY